MTFCGGCDFLLWREKREGNDGKNVLVLVAFLSFFQCSLESRTTRDAQGDRWWGVLVESNHLNHLLKE